MRSFTNHLIKVVDKACHLTVVQPFIESKTAQLHCMNFVLVSDLFEALSELIILTASSCLHGKEIRSMLNERVAQLYADLDGGFSHAAWLLPGWLPLPSFRYCWRSSGYTYICHRMKQLRVNFI